MTFGAFGFMIGAGGSAIVAKTMGEGDSEKANDYFSLLITTVVISGIILSFIAFIFMREIAVFLGATGDIVENCVMYGRVLTITLTVFLLQHCFQSFLIVAEKPTMGLKISILAGLINMLFDFLFIYVFKWGYLEQLLHQE